MAKKITRSRKVSEPEAEEVLEQRTNSGLSPNSLLVKIKTIKLNRSTYLALAVGGLLVLAVVKKDWFIAATVNGQPITNYEVIARMNEQYRNQTLTQLENERIVLDEAKKQGVVVNSSELDARMKKLEESLGGAEAFNNLLTQQGQTKKSVERQVRIQILIEKMYANEASVSAEEINKFIEENKTYLSSSDSAKQKEEATEAIKQQKVSSLFSTKFQELKSKANIKTF